MISSKEGSLDHSCYYMASMNAAEASCLLAHFLIILEEALAHLYCAIAVRFD